MAKRCHRLNRHHRYASRTDCITYLPPSFAFLSHDLNLQRCHHPSASPVLDFRQHRSSPYHRIRQAPEECRQCQNRSPVWPCRCSQINDCDFLISGHLSKSLRRASDGIGRSEISVMSFVFGVRRDKKFWICGDGFFVIDILGNGIFCMSKTLRSWFGIIFVRILGGIFVNSMIWMRGLKY